MTDVFTTIKRQGDDETGIDSSMISSSDGLHLLALPDLCAACIVSSLRGEEVTKLIETSRYAHAQYRPLIQHMCIKGAHVPDDWDDKRFLHELSAVLRTLPVLAHVKFVHNENYILQIPLMSLWAMQTARGPQPSVSQRLRYLDFFVSDMPTYDLRRVLRTLALMMSGGDLPALEELRMLAGEYRYDEEYQPVNVEFMKSLGHANAPARLTYLRICCNIEEEASMALAGSMEARAARGSTTLSEVPGRWHNFCEAASRVLRVCLPSLRRLDCDWCSNDQQPAVDAVAHELRAISAPVLEEMVLYGVGHEFSASAISAALRYGHFPKLTTLDFSYFEVGPTALQDLMVALRDKLVGLQTLRINYSPQHAPGLEATVGIFEEGGGACLRRLRVFGTANVAGGDAAFDIRMAAAIEAGNCPMLQEVDCGGGGLAAAALAARQAQG